MDLTLGSYSRLRKRSDEQVVRESAIPKEDIEAAVAFFIENPDIGAGKAHLTLVDEEEAWISTGNLNRVKQMLRSLVTEEYKSRHEWEKHLEAQLRKDLADRRKKNYVHIQADYPNHIWAIDFVNIKFLGEAFGICVVYDEFSQAYMGIEAALGADHELAVKTVKKAVAECSVIPKYMRRDNGKPFLTEEYLRELEEIGDYPIPPHSPWFNGSLESCNGSLKAGIKTIGMQKMAKDPGSFRKVRKSKKATLKKLGDIIRCARRRMNEKIARAKHQVSPAVAHKGEVQAAESKRETFKARKRQERVKRKKEMKKKPNHRPTTLASKIKTAVKRKIGGMDTSSIYVLNEVLHKRYQMFET